MVKLVNSHTKFEVRTIIGYEFMKDNAKCRNCGRLGWLEITQGHRQRRIR